MPYVIDSVGNEKGGNIFYRITTGGMPVGVIDLDQDPQRRSASMMLGDNPVYIMAHHVQFKAVILRFVSLVCHGDQSQSEHKHCVKLYQSVHAQSDQAYEPAR